MVDTQIINIRSSSTSSTITWTWNNGKDTGHVRTDRGPVPPNGSVVHEGNKSYTSQSLGGFRPNTSHSLTIHNWDANWGNHNQATSTAKTRSASTSGFALISRREEREKDLVAFKEFFGLLVSDGPSLAYYTLPLDAPLDSPWHLADVLALPEQSLVQDTGIVITQSFNTPDKLEALALIISSDGRQVLTSFQFTPDTGQYESFPVKSDGIIDKVTANPALVQNDMGLFQLLVYRGSALSLYTHPNETIEGPWKLVSRFAPPQGTDVIAIALVQRNSAGGLIAVARVRPKQGSDSLVVYESDANFVWRGPSRVMVQGQPIDRVTGDPTLLRSSNDHQENIELLVSLDGKIEHLAQLFTPDLELDAIANNWKLVQRLQPLDNDPNTQVLATSITQSAPGRLEAFAHVGKPGSSDLMIAYQFTKEGGWQDPIVLRDENGQPIIAKDSSSIDIPPVE